MATVETLNVKIEANASSLKKEANESIKVLERLKEKYNEVSAELSNAFAKKGKADYISGLTQQRNEIKKLIDALNKGLISPSDSSIAKALGEAQVEAQGLNNDLQEVNDTQKEINNGWDNSGLKKLASQMKKIAASIVGVATVFSLIRKGMRTYLSQNEELQAKLNGIYYAIGSMFAPILE